MRIYERGLDQLIYDISKHGVTTHGFLNYHTIAYAQGHVIYFICARNFALYPRAAICVYVLVEGPVCPSFFFILNT
jgi:hypothetical protein